MSVGINHELVISCRDTPPILEAAEGAFDDISPSVGDRVERPDLLSGWIVGNDWLGATRCKEVSQSIAVVGSVCCTQACRRQRLEQWNGNGGIAALPRCYSQGDWTATTIDNSMDFCRSAASRATDCLGIGPPFPPAAERCAFAVVLSIIWMSRSVDCTRALNSRRHIPLADQRWKRL
jgi:hypothetical protein